MGQVQGKNGVLFGRIGSNWFMIGCEINAVFTYENELIGKTSVNSLDREYRARIGSSSGTLEGVTTLTNTTTASIFYYLQQQVRRAALDFKYIWTDDDANTEELDMTAVIKQISISAQQGDWSKFNMDLQGTGNISLDPVIGSDGSLSSSSGGDSLSEVDANVDSASWDAVEGDTTISGLSVDGKSFEGKHILMVSRTGAPHGIVTGTPGNLEAQVSNPAGTAIGFLNPFNIEETVFVIWEDA